MARPRLPLVINGIDFSEAANRTGYSIQYEERMGDNGFLALSGDQELDILAYKPIITWPLNALWSDELAQLKTAIRSATFVPVSYFDTDTNQTKTAYFHGSISQESVPLVSSRGYMLSGMTLTLRAR